MTIKTKKRKLRKLRKKDKEIIKEIVQLCTDTGIKTRKLKKRYKKQKCAFYMMNLAGENIRCKRNAVGSSTLCSDHGGERIDKKNLILASESTLSINSKFKPHIHPILFIDLSRQGMSEVEIAAEFQIGVSTLKKWSETFAEMATAYEIGKALHEAWWLQQGKSGLNNVRNFNTNLFKFLTGNKLGYSDKIQTTNLNMNTHGVLLVPGVVSESEWAEQNAAEDIRGMRDITNE
jgi:hypothetical protein